MQSKPQVGQVSNRAQKKQNNLPGKASPLAPGGGAIPKKNGVSNGHKEKQIGLGNFGDIKTRKNSAQKFTGIKRHSSSSAGGVVGDYAMVTTIGRGSHAQVKLGINLKTGMKAALKIINKRTSDSMRNKREMIVLRGLKHPKIITLLHVYESSKHLYMVLEYCPRGDLFEYALSSNGLKREECLSMFAQIVKAVMFCHYYGIIHRDIKPENILLKDRGRVVLTDFGLCGVENRQMKTFCGSPHYVSPEICKGTEYDYGSEAWGLGVLLYIMFTATYPFQHRHMPTLLKKITTGVFFVPENMPEDIAELVSMLLVVDRKHRMPVHKIYVARCFSDEEGVNMYFCAEDIDWPKTAMVDATLVRKRVVDCLSIIGYGSRDEVYKRITTECHEIGTSHYHVQLMYKALAQVFKAKSGWAKSDKAVSKSIAASASYS